MIAHNVFVLAGFQLVWLACAIGAASGLNSPGVTAAAMYLLALAILGRLGKHDIRTIVVAGLCGLLAESVLAWSGLVSYRAAWVSNSIAPPWIVALWIAFGATISPTLQLLGSSAYSKAAGLGLLFGPLAYMAGDRLGALSIDNGPWLTLTTLAIFWAAIYPGLLYLRSKESGP